MNRKNSFVACGGTGAHVMLAMVRLHILGYPFGFFVSKKGETKNEWKFPDMFLVDQDYHQKAADERKNTAWGEVQNLIEKHPGRYRYKEIFGIKRVLSPRENIIRPLPLGPNGNWSDYPNDSLGFRFQDSERLRLITSKEQRDIRYSEGMMASPLVGAIVSSLKEYDTEDGRVNNDEKYIKLLDTCRGNVVICGSIVGGTGASVAPTLARRIHDKYGQEAKVMSVLIHRWFELGTSDESKQEFCKDRNKKMRENAACGIVYSSQELAGKVATVLVGVPDAELVRREWGEYNPNNQQSYKDSYAHVIGALAGMQHLLSDQGEVDSGLYGLSASDSSRLTGDIEVGKGAHSRLDDMIGHAKCLSYALGVYCKVLKDYKHPEYTGARRWLNYINFGDANSLQLGVCEWVYKVADKNDQRVKRIAEELEAVKEFYDDLLTWLKKPDMKYDMPDIPGTDEEFFNLERNFLGRKKKEKLPSLDGYDTLEEDTGITVEKEEYIALAVFHWTADWIRNWWQAEKSPTSINQAQDGYWPSVVRGREGGKSGITWKESPGELSRASEVSRAISPYYDQRDISSNGRPDPIGVVNQCKFQVEQKDQTAIRKLELLLIGRAQKILNLEKVRIPPESSRDALSIESLIDEEYRDLVRYRLVHHKNGKIYGFTSSPVMLLCPTPDTSDKEWEDLWKEINNHVPMGKDWQNSEEWRGPAVKAMDCIAAWMKALGDRVQDDYWKVLSSRFKAGEANTSAFGIAEWLPVSSGGKPMRIPLPVKGNSIIAPEDDLLDDPVTLDYPDIEEIKEHIVEFDQVQDFWIIEDVAIPGLGGSRSMIWQDHLDKLQEKGYIFAWWRGVKDDEVWIMKKDMEAVIRIKNLRVIDEKTIKIKTCIPFIQRAVPRSNVEDDSLKFPDIPLLPDYISLAKSSSDKEEKSLVNVNWEGLDDIPYTLDRKNAKVTWRLHLEGRISQVKVVIGYSGVQPVGAHWMIWPNFKAPSGSSQWKAYYIYEHSTKQSLRASAIFGEGDNLSVSEKRKEDSLNFGRAVAFDTDKGHIGGPPVALCAYDGEREEYVGLYKVKLHEFRRSKFLWKLAVDFGTSHTVAAVEIDEKKEPVFLKSEFAGGENDLSLHISENWIDGDSEGDNETKSEMQLDLWRPTYAEEGEQSVIRSELPSDLWSIKDLSHVDTRISKIKQLWEPMTHYAIPPKKLKRSDSEHHSISGFKWQIRGEGKGSGLKGEESWLQEKYLVMALEIFVADIAKGRKSLPAEIQFTFTYPLRGTTTSSSGSWITEKYKKTINNVLKCSKKNLGYEVTKEGLYSESHAAAGTMGTGKPFEVKLVADLGGGTLDIFISTSDIPVNDDERPPRFEKEAADSVRIGADLLLDILSRGGESENYLPRDGTWGKNDITRFRNLRAWMRSEGAYRLFNPKYTNWKSEDLGLTGFGKSGNANKARRLIDGYFRLIADFMARSLVAYVKKDVWDRYVSNQREGRLEQHEFGKTKLIVQLQGNGWLLWYGSDNYDVIQRTIVGWVRERADQLWGEADKDMDAQLSKFKDLWLPLNKSSDKHKLAPILNAVGESKDPIEEKERYTFPLSRVLLERIHMPDEPRDWFEALPFEPSGKNIRVEDATPVIDGFDPPLHVHSLVKNIDKEKEINEEMSRIITTSQGSLDVPIAAIIWEEVIESSEFRKN